MNAATALSRQPLCAINPRPTMIEDNSGIFYSFKLDHNLGYGFVEFYDFTDLREFDGRFVFVYNLVHSKPHKQYNISEITNSGIALGPLAFYKAINTRGIGAWKRIGKTDKYIMDSWPVVKDLRANPHLHYDWSKFDKWYIQSRTHDPLCYVPYETVRRYESLTLSSTLGAKLQFTMKVIIDSGRRVSDYYDLSDLGTQNSYVRLINTYYSHEMTKELINDIPASPYGGA